MKRLEQWSLVHVYTALGRTVTRAKGEIYGHAELPDGTEVTTSEIVERLPKTRQVVTWSGGVYQLDDPPSCVSRGHARAVGRDGSVAGHRAGRGGDAMSGVPAYKRIVERSAVISDCGQYRYRLTRTWDDGVAALPIVMLNPSIADADVDDPTIRKCCVFADLAGYGGIEVVNLFAWRATKPSDLQHAEYPVGPDNWSYLQAVGRAPRVLVAWGSWGSRPWVRTQVSQCVRLLGGARLVCLGTTSNGDPVHPLMQPYSRQMVEWPEAPHV